MKKIKLLGATVATCLTVCAPLCISLSSCGGNHDIDIKKNKNITIECKEIVVGKDLTMTYQLDDNYAFDLAGSTITFEDTNTTITLVQCEVDRIKKTITVPGEFVTSKKVTIDIKAEDARSSTINQAEFTTAISKLVDVNESRAFTADAGVNMYDRSKEGKIVQNFASIITAEANGKKEHIKIVVEDTGYSECWTEPAEAVGFWEYQQDDGGLTYRSPQNIPILSETITNDIFDNVPRQIAQWIYDPLYNAYYYDLPEQTSNGTMFMVITNKNISYVGGIGWSTSSEGDTEIVTQRFEFTYESKTVTCPTQYIDSPEPNFIHNEVGKYVGKTKGVQYEFDKKDSCLGRYTVPMSYYSSWDFSKPIVISLDCEDKKYLDTLVFDLAEGTTAIDHSKFNFDTTTGLLTITGGTLTTATKPLTILCSCKRNTPHPIEVTNLKTLDIRQE